MTPSGHPDDWSQKEWDSVYGSPQPGTLSRLWNGLIDTDKSMIRKVIDSLVIGLILMAFSYAVGFAAGWITEVNKLEAFAVFTSYASTWLCVVESRSNYIFGVISTFAYCLLFIQFDLVASAMVNGYLVLSLAYGFFRWRSDENTKPVQHVALKWLPVYALVTAVAYGIALLLTNLAGGHLAKTDTVILVGTILAQFLLDNKKIETWMVWAVVNVFAIYTYFNADLALAGFQYIFFLLNTVLGYVAWRKSMNRKITSTNGDFFITPQGQGQWTA